MGAMNWRVNENPTEDGTYLLAEFTAGSLKPYYISDTSYTTDGGWNTHKSYATGETRFDHGWGFEPAATWAWIPIEETGVIQAKKENAPCEEQ